MDLALHWYDKRPNSFRITHSEQEDELDGTVDTPRDTSVIDFACFRQGFCFCSGSFYAFSPDDTFGPVVCDFSTSAGQRRDLEPV